MDNIAILGATTNTGRKILTFLHEYGYSVKNIIALDDHEFEGHEISFGNKVIEIECLQHFDFNETDIVISTLESNELSEFYCTKAKNNGCLVIDTSSAFRYNENIPLIISDINSNDLSNNNSKIITVPNSITVQTLLAIQPIEKLFSIKRIVISTYQAVSGNGKKAMDELFTSTKKIYENSFIEPKEFKKPISFNVIPQIGEYVGNNEYRDEYEIRKDINKIYKGKIKTSVTCVNVPVFNCHSVSINIECNNEADLELLKNEYEMSDSIMVIDNPEEYIYATPKECSLNKNIFISRLRKDNSIKFGINMWIVADNLVSGIATNIIKILQLIQNK